MKQMIDHTKESTRYSMNELCFAVLHSSISSTKYLERVLIAAKKSFISLYTRKKKSVFGKVKESS